VSASISDFNHGFLIPSGMAERRLRRLGSTYLMYSVQLDISICPAHIYSVLP